MKVTIKSITGFNEAFVSMFISKRTWTSELDAEITKVCDEVVDKNGNVNQNASPESLEKFNKWLTMLLKMGRKHITVLRFIDIAIMTEGLHRAGQDDCDAHARRFDNRIIRSSTRLATFQEGEVSDWYKDKILTTNKMCENLCKDMPEKVYELSDGYFYTKEEYESLVSDPEATPPTVAHIWIKAANGYILEEHANDKDVMRGLYPLSIPSNFISKINLCEWAHVFKERNENGGANPEVKIWAESVMKEITNIQSLITRDYVLTIEN